MTIPDIHESELKLRPWFPIDLAVRLYCENDGTDQLTAPFAFVSPTMGYIEVPAGFVTDYASVPRVVGAYLLFGGRGRKASVIHDWAYSAQQFNDKPITREQADQVFREALIASGYTAATVWMMYQGVRLGGGRRWDRDNVPQPAHVANQMLPETALA